MLTIAAAVLLATSLSALAGNGQGQNNNNQGQNNGGHYGAPGPIAGAGLPILAVGAVGYGIYWFVRRRRRTD